MSAFIILYLIGMADVVWTLRAFNVPIFTFGSLWRIIAWPAHTIWMWVDEFVK